MTQPPEDVIAFKDSVECPDCISETGQPQLDPERDVWWVPLYHDHTCPYYRQREGR